MQENFSEVFSYKKRIIQLENEIKNLRNLTQQNILSQHESMKYSICQRQLEETVLKFNIDMLDHCFGHENFQFKKDNREIES